MILNFEKRKTIDMLMNSLNNNFFFEPHSFKSIIFYKPFFTFNTLKFLLFIMVINSKTLFQEIKTFTIRTFYLHIFLTSFQEDKTSSVYKSDVKVTISVKP